MNWFFIRPVLSGLLLLPYAILSLLLSAPAFAAPADAYIQRDVMQCGGVEVVLVSSCRSVTVDDAETHLIPVCSDQTINICGKVLRRDIGKVSQLTSDGVKTKMLSNVVVAMDCVAGWSLPLPGLQRMEKRSCSSMTALALRPIPNGLAPIRKSDRSAEFMNSPAACKKFPIGLRGGRSKDRSLRQLLQKYV